MSYKRSKAEAKSPSYSPTEPEKKQPVDNDDDDDDDSKHQNESDENNEDSPISDPSVESLSPSPRQLRRRQRPFLRRSHIVLRAIYNTRNIRYIDATYDTRTWTVDSLNLRLVNVDAYHYLRNLLLRARDDARSINLNNTELHWLQDLRSDEHY